MEIKTLCHVYLEQTSISHPCSQYLYLTRTVFAFSLPGMVLKFFSVEFGVLNDLALFPEQTRGFKHSPEFRVQFRNVQQTQRLLNCAQEPCVSSYQEQKNMVVVFFLRGCFVHMHKHFGRLKDWNGRLKWTAVAGCPGTKFRSSCACLGGWGGNIFLSHTLHLPYLHTDPS